MLTYTHRVIVEFGDCDPAGIVFFPRFFAMFDAATAFLLESASGSSRATVAAQAGILGWPMVDIRAQFHAPITYDDRIEIRACIAHVGRSSFKVEHKLYRDDQLCVECLETRVWTARNPQTRRLQATPIPDSLRARLLAPAARDR